MYKNCAMERGRNITDISLNAQCETIADELPVTTSLY